MGNLNKYEAVLADRYSTYSLRDILLILESYEEKQRKIELLEKSELHLLTMFCKYLNDTGTMVNASDIQDYISNRNSK